MPKTEETAPVSDVLPDLLQPGLKLVFVGTAAGKKSAELGQYYAKPGNKFWQALYDAGLTPRLYDPSEYQILLKLGIGFTDLAKTQSGMDHELTEDGFDKARFDATIRRNKPHAIAFTSKKAASIWLGKPTGKIPLGRLQHGISDFPAVFVLPSPSGLATSHWTLEPWKELADWLSHNA